MTGGAVAAIDLGATSGRVMIGRVATGCCGSSRSRGSRTVRCAAADGLHWDFSALYAHILDGLREAVRREPGSRASASTRGRSTTAWSHGGELLGEPFHYRDERTARGVETVHATVPFEELYRRNGLQFLPFNTLYQYATEQRVSPMPTSSLLIPDLVAFLLTGARVAERTNASTTGLVDVRTGEWDLELAARLGIPASVLPPLVDPGAHLGRLQRRGRERSRRTARGHRRRLARHRFGDRRRAAEHRRTPRTSRAAPGGSSASSSTSPS